MNEWEERMGNVTKIKLKSAKHKTKVGERGGKQQQHFYPVLFTKHGEMLNDKIKKLWIFGAPKFIKALTCFAKVGETRLINNDLF